MTPQAGLFDPAPDGPASRALAAAPDVSEAEWLEDLADAAIMLGRLGGREGIGANSVTLLRAEIVVASRALAELWGAEDPA